MAMRSSPSSVVSGLMQSAPDDRDQGCDAGRRKTEERREDGFWKGRGEREREERRKRETGRNKDRHRDRRSDIPVTGLGRGILSMRSALRKKLSTPPSTVIW
eukprot:2402211-Rhodomonas_salina.3